MKQQISMLKSNCKYSEYTQAYKGSTNMMKKDCLILSGIQRRISTISENKTLLADYTA
jgi:hypothetical protein